MSRLARVFGLEGATEQGIHLVRVISVLFPAFAASFQISTTFWMIYIAESLGNGDYIAGLGLVGILVIVQLSIQTALDYPTGALGDHIGQRYVIASALFCFGVAFWLTSTVTQNTPFLVFVAIYALMGFGASQQSGAFQAWFDNNYRAVMPHDKDRKQYGVFWGRLGMVFQISSTAVLIPGSIFALIYGRPLVFLFQSVFCFILGLAVLRVLNDLPEVEEHKKEEHSSREYTTILKNGVRFLLADRFVLLTILGECVLMATGTLWWNLLLFPLYFTYLLTDVAVSSFRTLIFIPQAGTQERSGIWSKRFEPVKWIPRFRLMQFCGFFFFIVLSLTTFFFQAPPTSSETIGIYLNEIPIIEMPAASLVPVLLIYSLFIVAHLFGGFANILTQRVMIDVIPNKIRNSMYSLKPTIAMILAIPLLGIFGWLLPLYDFSLTFVLIAFISLFGAIMIHQGFKHPIPKLPEIEPASPEESEEIEEMDAL